MPEPVTVYFSLGSNLGDRRNNLEKALELLSQRLKITAKSSVYDTEPWGVTWQPRFLNMVCQALTTLSPQALLSLAKGIESRMGRKGGNGQPRSIDIDILLYGDEVVESSDLTVPHPAMTNRAFVLIPLNELAPDLVHPVTGKTVSRILKDIKGEQGVMLLET
jgi:2-amino-4-hydroxy-6-hydroxymethyldihydropteridine diphosphokinase